MDTRRLKLLPLARYKLKYLWHLLAQRRDWANARSYIWATLFSRDAGLALQDPIYRHFPRWAPYPRQMELEVTTACHLRCVICEHTYWREPALNLSFPQFRRIVDQFPRLRWIGLTGIGSIYLNPHSQEMLRYLKEEKRCFVEFFDSFTQLDEARARELVRLGVNKIWVSLEAASRETYERLRVGADFDRVIANIQTLIRLKRQERSPLPELWFHFIVNRLNLAEMEAYVDLVARLAAVEGGLSAPLIYWSKLLAFEENAHLAVAVPPERLQGLARRGREQGVFVIANENLGPHPAMRTCAKWNEPFVLVSGHVQPCCALNEANARPYQVAHAFANLLETDFHQWWRSPQREEFLRRLQGGEVNPVCVNCHIFRHPQAPEDLSIRDWERRQRQIATGDQGGRQK